MKKELEYYYGLENIEVHHKDKMYIILKNKSKYIFKPCYRNYQELTEIFNLLDSNYNSYFHKIILNNSSQLITMINNIPYILLKLQIEDDRFIDFNDILEFDEKSFIFEHLNLRYIIRTDWVKLWSRKIDYFEYQMDHMKDKYKILSTSIDFYIGLAENGISYINQILGENTKKSPSISVCHRRLLYKMTITEFFDPTELIIDYKARDVCEYLKSLFLCEECDFVYLESFFRKLSLSKEDYEMLFGRLLFPSFYFDVYEEIVNRELNEKEILKIIGKSQDYVLFLKKIYNIIYRIYPIKKIDWI